MPEIRLTEYQYAAIYNPFSHFALYAGVGCGKSYSGSHFSIRMMQERPDISGFIAANTYDQLSQVSLKELFYWLNEYGIEFVVDRRPPQSWQAKTTLKNYKNVLSVRIYDQVVTVYLRTLSEPDNIRGMEFSWYWLDETRDTTQYAHDMILARMRESDVQKGLITTTTNGESWDFKRFVRGGNSKDRLFGSMHVQTIESVKAGIITQQYYDTLLKSYSPQMAAQELDAQHVNIFGGRAYYAASERNRKLVAPWGDRVPNPNRPLIIGCDFNFSPAPCVWVVGQCGPNQQGPNGEWWPDHIHWFGELSEVEISTRGMTRRLVGQYPGFFYRIIGDMSGNVGTTSNAGETDFNQINDELAKLGQVYSVDAIQFNEDDLKRNPFVKDRVENTNALLMNAVGDTRMTYNPVTCPLLDGDFRMVGWKVDSARGKGKLDSGGDVLRTHASDAAGYAVFRVYPPGRRAVFYGGVESATLKEFGLTRG